MCCLCLERSLARGPDVVCDILATLVVAIAWSCRAPYLLGRVPHVLPSEFAILLHDDASLCAFFPALDDAHAILNPLDALDDVLGDELSRYSRRSNDSTRAQSLFAKIRAIDRILDQLTASLSPLLPRPPRWRAAKKNSGMLKRKFWKKKFRPLLLFLPTVTSLSPSTFLLQLTLCCSQGGSLK